MTEAQISEPLAATPLQGLHRARGAHMVGFEGYEVPAHYAGGAGPEHNHTGEHPGLLDISYLGPAFLAAPDHETLARALETLVPARIVGLCPGHQRHPPLLN